MLPPLKPKTANTTYGRDAEIERIRTFIAQMSTARHRGSAILITGEPGVGKTRLVQSMKRDLRKAGSAILECVCRPDDDRPNGVFVELFARGVQHLGDADRSTRPLERTIDRLTGLADYTDGGQFDSSDEQLRLCETVRAALIEVSSLGMPAIFIEDLHWADSATVDVIGYLFDNLLTDPAFDWTPPETEEHLNAANMFHGLVVTSFRVTETTRPLVEAASATKAIEHIELSGLDIAGVREFAQSDAVVARLLQATNGNPKRLQQLVDALPASPDDTLAQTQHVRPPVQTAVLDVLAVVSRPCTIRQITELLQGTALPADVESLVRARLLERSLKQGRPSFSFARHSDARDWLMQMDSERKASLHLLVAEKLAGGLEAEPEEVARHFLAAGALAEAVPFTITAANRLQAALAHDRAAHLLEQVVDVTEGSLEIEIVDQLATLYSATGRTAQARQMLDKLGQLAPNRGPELDARAAHLLLSQGAYAEANALVSTRLHETLPIEIQHELNSIAADAAYRLGDLATAEAHCAAINDGEALINNDATLSLRNTLGKVHLFRENFDQARSLFDDNLEAARQAEASSHQAKALINLGVVQLQQGDPDDALVRFEMARQLTEETGDLANLSISLENLAVLHHRRQSFREALSFYHQSTVTSRRMGRRRQLTTSALNLADLYLTVGDIDRAHRLADIAAEYIRSDSLRFLESQQTMLAGDIARALGESEKASDHYNQAVAQIERGERTNQRLGPLLWAQAELCLETKDLDRAQRFVDQALGLASLPSESLAVRLRMTQGSIHAARGDLAAAASELEASVNGAVERNDREAVWQARARLGMTYWRQGDTERARALLSRSLEVIERVAAELPPSLRRIYRHTAARRNVRDGLRRLRSGLPPSKDNLKNDQKKTRQQSPGEYQQIWRERYPKMIGRSPTLFPVFKALDRVSGSDSMMLIRGESGTGKELVAAALHTHSHRHKGPFVKVNCAAFVETLLLSELFGHEKGAFTGAVSTKKGRFELADGGTLFLDEIGDISPNTQVALLRVLQEGAFERVGGQETVSVNVRVVCATHRNLEEMVKDGTFRADLYYRLRGVVIELPALRDRPTDIPLLVEHFLARQRSARQPNLRFDHDALASLFQHDWPGNIRELENVVRSVVLFADGDTVDMKVLAELGDILPAPSEAAIAALNEALEIANIPIPAATKSATPNTAQNPSENARVLAVPLGGESATGTDMIPAADNLYPWLEKMILDSGSLSEFKKRIEFEAIAGTLREEKGNITRSAKRLGMKRPRLSQIIHGNIELGAIKEKLTESE